MSSDRQEINERRRARAAIRRHHQEKTPDDGEAEYLGPRDFQDAHWRVLLRAHGALECALRSRRRAESARDFVKRCGDTYGFRPDFGLQLALDSILERHLWRRGRKAHPSRAALKDRLDTIRQSGSLKNATTLEILMMSRHLPGARGELPSEPREIRRLAMLAYSQKGEPESKQDIALHVLYKRLLKVYEDGTGRKPAVPDGRKPGGYAYRFVKACCEVLGESLTRETFREAVKSYLEYERSK